MANATAPKREDFKTVQFFRKVKEKLSNETYDMTFTELKEYLKEQKSLAQTATSDAAPTVEDDEAD